MKAEPISPSINLHSDCENRNRPAIPQEFGPYPPQMDRDLKEKERDETDVNSDSDPYISKQMFFVVFCDSKPSVGT